MNFEESRRRLGDIAAVIAGQSPEGKFYNEIGKGHPFYQGKKEFREKYIGPPTTWTSQVTKEALADDILMSVRAPVGPVNFSTERICIGRGLAAIRCREGLDKEFLFYFLLSKEAEISGREGAVFASINKSEVEAIQIPVPTLPEQRRIVGILDEAFEGIATAKAHAEKNLQNARAMFESHLQSVFSEPNEGWESLSFEDCIESVKYTSKIQRKDFLEKGRYPILSQEAEFINGFWDDSTDVFKVEKPMVIFGDHTQVLKYVDFDFVLGADGVKILLPKSFLNAKFFFYQLRSTPKITLGYARHYRLLKERWVSFPEKQTQSRIVGEMDSLERETQRLESIYQRKLAALDALKQSLLHQAFSGQL